MKILVIGAGVGGKLAARGIKDNFPDSEVILAGPESKDPEGLFYFNEKIPGVAEKPVNVTYGLVGGEGLSKEEIYKKYQIKSRGFYEESFKVSSLNKVGSTEVGYLLNPDVNLTKDITWYKKICRIIHCNSNSFSQYAVLDDSTYIEFDYMISTIPINNYVKIVYGKDISGILKYQPIYVKNMVSDSFNIYDTKNILVDYDIRDTTVTYRRSEYNSDSGYKLVCESIKEGEGLFSKIYPGKILPTDLTYETENGTRYEFTPDNLEKWSGYDIKILGRFARWDYHYLVTDTYKDAIKFINEKLNGGSHGKN